MINVRRGKDDARTRSNNGMRSYGARVYERIAYE